jgi:hypothetical protein
MKRWIKWGAAVLACAACTVLGMLLGSWLSFRAYGSPAERIAIRLVDEALIVRLAAEDGATARSSQLVRTLLPSVQSNTASVVFLDERGLNAPYPQLLRRALRQLDGNPIVQADESEWAAAAKAARACILASPPGAAGWSGCAAPVKAAWPKPLPEGQKRPVLARTP